MLASLEHCLTAHSNMRHMSAAVKPLVDMSWAMNPFVCLAKRLHHSVHNLQLLKCVQTTQVVAPYIACTGTKYRSLEQVC